MTTRLVLLIIPLLMAGMAMTSAPAQVEGAAPDQDFSGAVKASDYVVTGVVIGMVNSNPSEAAPADRKIREAHRVVVQTTLKGHDIAGRKVVVRPNTLLWNDGDTYVLFLKDRGNGFFDAIPEPVLTKSAAEIAALASKLGFAVLPRLQLRLRNLGGCCSTHSGTLQDLRVMADGRFELRTRVTTADGHLRPEVDVLTGVLPKSAISNLIKTATGIEKQPLPDGGGLVNLELAGESGKVDYLTFSVLDRPEVNGLLETAVALAREHAAGSSRAHQPIEK